MKIALGIQQKDNIEGKQWRYNSRDPSRASSRIVIIVIHTDIRVKANTVLFIFLKSLTNINIYLLTVV